jgi:CheY-like chemotaxis protein
MAKEILIADSDKMVRKEFEKIFEATDYQIIFSKNDEEALLRGKLFKPDLIIGGRDLCSSVRADVELKDLPFILILNTFEDLSESERKLLQ